MLPRGDLDVVLNNHVKLGFRISPGIYSQLSPERDRVENRVNV